jgi:hypothetical protein
MMIPPPPRHLIFHEKYLCNIGSATIALTGTLPATILPLGLIEFLLFNTKLHHFYHANFVTQWPS